MNAMDLLRKALTDMGADGLYNGTFGEDACGCGLCDLTTCGYCDLEDCVPAKQKSDGLFYPMEATCPKT